MCCFKVENDLKEFSNKYFLAKFLVFISTAPIYIILKTTLILATVFLVDYFIMIYQFSTFSFVVWIHAKLGFTYN